jgi:hypothetical protein
MNLFKESRSFVSSLLLLILLNVLVKPLWIFGIDRQVQNITGYAAYGGYFALLNLSIVLNFLLDLGITPYFNRTVAAEHGRGRILFSQAFSIKLLLGIFYGVIVLMVAWFSGALTGKLLFMLMLMQVLNSFSPCSGLTCRPPSNIQKMPGFPLPTSYLLSLPPVLYCFIPGSAEVLPLISSW